MRIISLTMTLALLACLTTLGCSATPQTWEQITTRRYKVPVQSERIAERRAQGLPDTRPLVWDASTDQYNWAKGYTQGDAARAGEGFDLEMRNPDFPNTYIREVHVSVTSPTQWVYVVWAGPLADNAPAGPWHSSPGRGNGECDCDTVQGSNTLDSNCTPKGIFRVKGFDDKLRIVPGCFYATWVVHKPRLIALHSNGDIPNHPTSGGCIRLPFEAAKLIHNNSITGVTLVKIAGKWTDPRLPKPNARDTSALP